MLSYEQEKLDWKADYILTCCVPYEIQVMMDAWWMQTDALIDFLGEVYQRTEFRHLFFGHYHLEQNVTDKMHFCISRYTGFAENEGRNMCDIQLLREALLGSARPSEYFNGLLSSGTLSELYPEVAALAGVPQDPVYHPEGDVYAHTMMVLDYAASIRDRAAKPFPFMLSALSHDFGKVTVTEVRDDGRIHSYGHEEAGIPVAEGMLHRIGADADTASYVGNMIRLHMEPNRKYREKSAVKSTNKMFDASVCPEDLLLLAQADHFGKLQPVPYGECRNWLQGRLDMYRETMSRPYVSEADLLGYGAKPGAELEELLAYTHKLRVSGNTKESVEKAARSMLRKMQRQEEMGVGN